MRAIVTGVTGQDGYFMTKRLLADGFEVVGLTTAGADSHPDFPDDLGGRLRISKFDYGVEGAFRRVVEETEPDLVFNFAAIATGRGMFSEPLKINKLNGCFVVEVLEALRTSRRRDSITLCQASSSEMYGDVHEAPQTETTCFRPKSPYGAAKLFAHNLVGIYRATYDVRCCSAILYNHESTRRSTDFVTMKIANAAARIALGQASSVRLGSLESVRDWGYAPEYVDAMFRMATSAHPEDYVVATGRLTSVRDLCHAAFGHLGLDYREFVQTQAADVRANESINLQGNPQKIEGQLGWVAHKTVSEIIVEMVEHELSRLRSSVT